MPTSIRRHPQRVRCLNLPQRAVRRDRSARTVSSGQSGFSMVELLVVVTIILILTAAALITMVPNVQRSHANAGMELVLGEMRRAHERAVDERRIYRVTFAAPNQIQLDVGQVANVATTITGTTPGFVQAQPPLILPDGIQFVCVSGIPTAAGSVPDGLGSGSNAIDFDLARSEEHTSELQSL